MDHIQEKKIFEKGLEYYGQCKFDLALEQFNKILQNNSESVLALVGAGATYGAIKNFDNSVACLKKALILSPNDAFIEYNLANSYALAEKHEEAIKLFQEAIERHPKNALLLSGLGTVQKVLKNYDQAIETYKKAIKIEASVENWVNIANCYQAAGKLDDAVTGFQEVRKIEPNNIIALFSLADIYGGNFERYNDALEYYTIITQIEPNNKNAWYNIGWVTNKLGNFESASSYFKKALEIDDKFLLAWDQLISNYILLKKFDEAITSAKILKERVPESSVGWQRLSGIYSSLDRYEDVKETLIKYTEAFPSDGWGWNNLGWACYRLKDFNMAIEYGKKSVQIDAADKFAWDTIACGYFGLNEFEKALEHFNKAIEIDSKYITVDVFDAVKSIVSYRQGAKNIKIDEIAKKLAVIYKKHGVSLVKLAIACNKSLDDVFNELQKSSLGNIETFDTTRLESYVFFPVETIDIAGKEVL